ncbi:hypothetical protein V6N13_105194 [Hibiscus sabdariffa]
METSNNSQLWQTIAKARVLPKIQILGWWVGHEVVPVGKNLWVACLGCGICKMCEKEVETTLHAVRECMKTQELFSISGLDDKLPQGPFTIGKQWLKEKKMGSLESDASGETGC